MKKPIVVPQWYYHMLQKSIRKHVKINENSYWCRRNHFIGKENPNLYEKNDEIGNFRWKIVGVTLLSNDWKIEHAKWG